jgi:quercetin dioxygenase-like cupin family protein
VSFSWSGPGEVIVDQDPTTTNPELYKVIFENERVRVLEYKDKPGGRTTPHRHPDSVMYTLSSFRRRIAADGRQADVELQAGQVRWLGAQEHVGENIGDTDTHTIFVELKESGPAGSPTPDRPLGPTAT